MARGQRADVGDVRTSPNGYHYTRTKEGWTLTHRLVCESKLGRPIATNERVRFLDKDRTNLSPENLEVYRTFQSSLNKRIARLESKIEDLTAELEILVRERNDTAREA